jgi:hypothetical protein
LTRGKRAASSTATRRPPETSFRAQLLPAGPPPITRASKISIRLQGTYCSARPAATVRFADRLSGWHRHARPLLICDENNNRAIEVTRAGQIVWQYGSGDPNINEPVSGVAFASRLKNGHTLITDSNHARIVEIDHNKNVVWEYFTNTDANSNQRGGTGPLPTRAVRLSNGHTLVSDQYNHRVIEVNRNKQIVRTFGKINSPGYDTGSVSGGGLTRPMMPSGWVTTPVSRLRVATMSIKWACLRRLLGLTAAAGFEFL